MLESMFNQIIAQMTQTNPTLQTAMQHYLNSILHPELVETMNKITAQYQPREYFILVYWLDAHFAQGKALAHEMTNLLNGVTCSNGALGLYKSPIQNQIVTDEILFIKAFATAEEMSQHLETILNRVRYWGGVCAQEAMAVEIGSMMGSMMLLMPTT